MDLIIHIHEEYEADELIMSISDGTNTIFSSAWNHQINFNKHQYLQTILNNMSMNLYQRYSNNRNQGPIDWFCELERPRSQQIDLQQFVNDVKSYFCNNGLGDVDKVIICSYGIILYF